ncbi:biotin transporter BioY [Rickettsiales bacterium LUAb2]
MMHYKKFAISSLTQPKKLISTSTLFSIIVGSIILAAFSQISIPLYPVPLTGQTLGLFILGTSLGARNGFLSVALYLILGIAGMPFFADSSTSISAILSSSGGYIVGFAFTTLIIGYLYNNIQFNSFPKFLLAAIIALIPTYALGMLWLSYVLGFNYNVIKFGLIPFISGELIKILIAYSLISASKLILKK